ncbi:MAG: hypothetical protein NT154_34880 [Verrucomicrobia bacterium]|nr:hypothetical protein [Verrucomicrobiota bacterium]
MIIPPESLNPGTRWLLEAWGQAAPRVSSLAYLVEENLLLLGTMGGPVYEYDLRSAKQTGVFNGHTDVVSSVMASRGGKWILTASYDQTVRVWNRESREQAHCLEGHNGAVFGASFVPNTPFAVSISDDRCIHLWDLKSGILATTQVMDRALYCCAATQDGKIVLAGTGAERGELIGFELGG